VFDLGVEIIPQGHVYRECWQSKRAWRLRRSSLLPRSIRRGCAVETSSCLITYRHQNLQALPFRHQSSTHSRHQTVRLPHPKTRLFRPVLPYRTRRLATTATPLRHMTEILPTIVSPRKPAATSWARCRPKNFSTCFFQWLVIPRSVRTLKGLSRAC
jgi:hypothetical protein